MRVVTTLTALVLVCLAQSATAQGTFTDTVSPGVNKYYSFTPSVSGQFTGTLSWDNQASILVLVVVCGTSSTQTYGIAAGQLDRVARLESGLIGLNPCVVGVATTNIIAAYRLTVQTATSQPATPQAATLTGVSLAGQGTLDARLVEQADRVLAAVKADARR